MKRRVLIVEDDDVFLRPLRRALELEGFEVLTASSGEEALDLLKREDVDLALTDQRLPGMDGVQVVRQLKAEHPEIGVVVMTAYGTIGAAVEATRLGAEDYLVKPFEPDEILLVLRRALEFRELRAQRRQSLRRNLERFTLTNLVAKSPKMLDIMALLSEVAQLDTTVLIHGETGVGKELLARTLHFAGPRRDKTFVAVNCAAIPEELFESELFGYRRGAFTGASEPRRGHFQLASGGTLLLDEIGEMPLAPPVEAAAGDRGEEDHADRRRAPDRHRRPVHRDHEPGPPGGRGERSVPARPVLPTLRVPAPRSRRSASESRTSRPSPRTSSSRAPGGARRASGASRPPRWRPWSAIPGPGTRGSSRTSSSARSSPRART